MDSNRFVFYEGDIPGLLVDGGIIGLGSEGREKRSEDGKDR